MYLPQGHDPIHGSSKLQVTILASDCKGGLSTIKRELANSIQIFLCGSHHLFAKMQKAADMHSVSILEALRLAGHNELDWLSFPLEYLRIDVVVFHGVKLGRQAVVIRKSHKCKRVQGVHTVPEELGMFKCYENPISTGK